jgi:hypothetical protein
MKYILMAFIALTLYSCSKSVADDPNLTINEEDATIQWWRYSCGTSCEAAAWVIELENGTAFEADALPPNFQQDDAEVIVKFKKTGKKSSLEQGTGLEQVRILNIRPK